MSITKPTVKTQMTESDKYQAKNDRYEQMSYQHCGNSGLSLPYVSLGLWHNFGGVDDPGVARAMLHRAFDLGINHFDLANNYGPPPGSAETFLGELMRRDFKPYRDELVISTKAGYRMWDGPYGDGGSRKYLLASLDQSLARLQLDYVDIFYHHRADPTTPLHETMQALADCVRSGKALYVGLSNYGPTELQEATELLQKLGTPCVVVQPKFSMLERTADSSGLLAELEAQNIGCVPYSPLAQGLLTNKYFQGIPENSRASKSSGFLQQDQVTSQQVTVARQLNELAANRGQTLAQLAITWLHSHQAVCSCIIGASRISQIEELVASQQQPALSSAELDQIERVLG